MGRSGKLQCVNDSWIYKLLKDPYFDVRSDGTILTMRTKTGKISIHKIWRIAGYNRKGYWEISYFGKHLRAHRVVFAKFKGRLKPDLVVYHRDGVGLNNHPDNLNLVTQAISNLQRFTRTPPVMGHRVLDWETVRVIRHFSNYRISYREISAQFGISKGHISEIVNNQIWIEGKAYHVSKKDTTL